MSPHLLLIALFLASLDWPYLDLRQLLEVKLPAKVDAGWGN